MYNGFDRIKINADLTGIEINETLFTKKVNSVGNVTAEEYKTVGLIIVVNYYSNKIYIDISSKILGAEYVDKINITNIREIYKSMKDVINISAKQFYSLEPNYCQVTDDVVVNDVPKSIDAMFRLSRLQNNYRPSAKVHKSDNKPTSFYLKKNVISRESSEYISIYNKKNEMFMSNKKENIAFLNLLSDDQRTIVENYFTSRLRIEATYNAKKSIRDKFGLNKDYNLYQLLTSTNNVLINMIDRVYGSLLTNSIHYPELTYKDFDRCTTLKAYSNDLDAILEKHRAMGSEVQKSKILRPYKEILSKMAVIEESEQITIIKNIKTKMKW